MARAQGDRPREPERPEPATRGAARASGARALRPAVAPAIVGARAFDVVAQARARRRLRQQHALLQPAVARRSYRPVVSINARLREGHLEAPAVSRVRDDASTA